MKKYVLILLAMAALSSVAQASTFTLDYNEGSYVSSKTDTFDIGQGVGSIESAEFSLYIAGRREYTNSRGSTWYYDSDVTLNAPVEGAWAHKSLPGTFELYTFQLNDAALASLETTGTFAFTLTGNDAYWESDSGWGYSTSRFYLDYAKLDVTAATVPSPATFGLLVAPALGLLGRRNGRRS